MLNMRNIKRWQHFMNLIHITICTNRKRRHGGKVLHAYDLPRGTQEEVTSCWLENLAHAEQVTEAKDLYCGRGFVEAIAAAKIARTEPWIISAGLGLVHARDRVPEYNLTIIPSTHDSIQQRITTTFSPSSWWIALNRGTGRSLSTLIKDYPQSIVLISLSQVYVKLVQNDLLQLCDSSLSKLRIVGLASEEILPERLKRAYVPYDTRLNDPQLGIPGTKSDFPQRAARHFTRIVINNSPGLESIEHAALVQKSLCGLSEPLIPKRKQMSNDEIIEVITHWWAQAEGQSSRMLRLLRDKLMIACEQKRFRSLFRKVKEGIEHG